MFCLQQLVYNYTIGLGVINYWGKGQTIINSWCACACVFLCVCVLFLPLMAVKSSMIIKQIIMALQGVLGRPGPEGKQGMKGEKVRSSKSNVMFCLYASCNFL